jgi:hypothetical protein
MLPVRILQRPISRAEQFLIIPALLYCIHTYQMYSRYLFSHLFRLRTGSSSLSTRNSNRSALNSDSLWETSGRPFGGRFKTRLSKAYSQALRYRNIFYHPKMRSETWLKTPLPGDCPTADAFPPPLVLVGTCRCCSFWTGGGIGFSPLRKAKADGASLRGVPIAGVAVVGRVR